MHRIFFYIWNINMVVLCKPKWISGVHCMLKIVIVSILLVCVSIEIKVHFLNMYLFYLYAAITFVTYTFRTWINYSETSSSTFYKWKCVIEGVKMRMKCLTISLWCVRNSSGRITHTVCKLEITINMFLVVLRWKLSLARRN